MNFLEAQRVLANFAGGTALPFTLAMSGTSTQLDIYLRAAAAEKSRVAEFDHWPFGTLGQMLRNAPDPSRPEVFLIYPWDFVPEADWRSGIPDRPINTDGIRANATDVASRIAGRTARVFYVAAPIPPLLLNEVENAGLSAWLLSLACSLGGDLLPAESFSLTSYLSNGCPIASSHLGAVARAVIRRLIEPTPQPCKVLVTDLDDTLWAGVIGEDGPQGIACAPEGIGFKHYLFQTLLAKLAREGTLLAVVSRNDLDVAQSALGSGRLAIREDAFVSVVCSYQPKSAQIRELARALNLGLDSFVFIDDNTVELAEVRLALPEVHCLEFPKRDEDMPRLLNELARLFGRTAVTREDTERTELYHRRIATTVPANAAGSDLTEFLRGLKMQMLIHDRSRGDRSRALQLINKTNQFNLNGIRVTAEEVNSVIDKGGRLYSATLNDRCGSHGEILACLVAADGTILSLAVSCRVLQRRVEHAFMAWLAGGMQSPVRLRFKGTQRNELVRLFLQQPEFAIDSDGSVVFDAAAFAAAHENDKSLFSLTVEC